MFCRAKTSSEHHLILSHQHSVGSQLAPCESFGKVSLQLGATVQGHACSWMCRAAGVSETSQRRATISMIHLQVYSRQYHHLERESALCLSVTARADSKCANDWARMASLRRGRQLSVLCSWCAEFSRKRGQAWSRSMGAQL